MTTNLNLKNLYFQEKEVGKTIKGTKKHYCWEFILNDKHRKIELYHSKLSAKRKVVYNGQNLLEDEGSIFDNDFTYSFTLQKNLITISQVNENKFDMKIAGKTFDYLMGEEKAGRLKYKEKEKETSPDKDKKAKEEKERKAKEEKEKERKEKEKKEKDKKNDSSKNTFKVTNDDIPKSKSNNLRSEKPDTKYDNEENFFDERDFNFDIGGKDLSYGQGYSQVQGQGQGNAGNNFNGNFQGGGFLDIGGNPIEASKQTTFENNKDIFGKLGAIDFFAIDSNQGHGHNQGGNQGNQGSSFTYNRTSNLEKDNMYPSFENNQASNFIPFGGGHSVNSNPPKPQHNNHNSFDFIQSQSHSNEQGGLGFGIQNSGKGKGINNQTNFVGIQGNQFGNNWGEQGSINQGSNMGIMGNNMSNNTGGNFGNNMGNFANQDHNNKKNKLADLDNLFDMDFNQPSHDSFMNNQMGGGMNMGGGGFMNVGGNMGIMNNQSSANNHGGMTNYGGMVGMNQMGQMNQMTQMNNMSASNMNHMGANYNNMNSGPSLYNQTSGQGKINANFNQGMTNNQHNDNIFDDFLNLGISEKKQSLSNEPQYSNSNPNMNMNTNLNLNFNQRSSVSGGAGYNHNIDFDHFNNTAQLRPINSSGTSGNNSKVPATPFD